MMGKWVGRRLVLYELSNAAECRTVLSVTVVLRALYRCRQVGHASSGAEHGWVALGRGGGPAMFILTRLRLFR